MTLKGVTSAIYLYNVLTWQFCTEEREGHGEEHHEDGGDEEADPPRAHPPRVRRRQRPPDDITYILLM